jgi:hypothetical protein
VSSYINNINKPFHKEESENANKQLMLFRWHATKTCVSHFSTFRTTQCFPNRLDLNYGHDGLILIFNLLSVHRSGIARSTGSNRICIPSPFLPEQGGRSTIRNTVIFNILRIKRNGRWIKSKAKKVAINDVFRRQYCNRLVISLGVTLTTHLHPVPRSRMSTSYTSSPRKRHHGV